MPERAISGCPKALRRTDDGITMEIGTILSLAISAVSLVVAVGAIRFATLDTRRGREDYLNRRFQDRNWTMDPFILRFDKIAVEEDTGVKYKIRRYLLGEFEGATDLSVYSNVHLPDEFWENDEYTEIYDSVTTTSIEMIHEDVLRPDHIQYVFRIDSADYDDISKDMLALLKYLELAVEDGMLEMSFYR